MMKTKTLGLSVAMHIILSANLVKSQDFENFPVTRVYISNSIRLYKNGLADVYPDMIACNTSGGIVVFNALQYPEVTKRLTITF